MHQEHFAEDWKYALNIKVSNMKKMYFQKSISEESDAVLWDQKLIILPFHQDILKSKLFLTFLLISVHCDERILEQVQVGATALTLC